MGSSEKKAGSRKLVYSVSDDDPYNIMMVAPSSVFTKKEHSKRRHMHKVDSEDSKLYINDIENQH